MDRSVFAMLAATVLAAPGCASWSGYASTGGGVAGGGGSTVITGPAGGYASVTFTGSGASVFFWAFGAGIYAAMLADGARYGQTGTAMPADRMITEVDCTKPLPEPIQGNLKCK